MGPSNMQKICHAQSPARAWARRAALCLALHRCSGVIEKRAVHPAGGALKDELRHIVWHIRSLMEWPLWKKLKMEIFPKIKLGRKETNLALLSSLLQRSPKSTLSDVKHSICGIEIHSILLHHFLFFLFFLSSSLRFLFVIKPDRVTILRLVSNN